MGSELIIAVCEQRFPRRTFSEVKQKLNDLTLLEAENIFEDAHGISAAELEIDEVLEYVKDRINEALNVAYDVEYSRSIITINLLSGQKLLIGGGDSWGDIPEGFDQVNMLNIWGKW